MCKVQKTKCYNKTLFYSVCISYTYPFLELLLEEGTYYGHDDTDVPGLVQYMKPLETGWKSFLQGHKTCVLLQ